MNKKDKNYDATSRPFSPELVLADRRNEIVRSIVGVVAPFVIADIRYGYQKNS